MIDGPTNEIELLDRHLVVLCCVIEQEPIGIFSLSAETGYPKHKVRTSLRTLEEYELIEPTPKGAVTTEKTSEVLSTINAQLEESTRRLEEIKVQLETPAPEPNPRV